MNIAEFRKKAKDLAVNLGLKRNDISITSDRWLSISIKCEDFELYKSLKQEFEKLAGFENRSDVMTDYFEYRLKVQNAGGGSYGGMIITRSH